MIVTQTFVATVQSKISVLMPYDNNYELPLKTTILCIKHEEKVNIFSIVLHEAHTKCMRPEKHTSH